MSDVKDYLSNGLLLKYIARANSIELCVIECQLNEAETAMKAEPQTPPTWWALLDRYKLAVAERREKTWF
jgi:hypothetical protein